MTVLRLPNLQRRQIKKWGLNPKFYLRRAKQNSSCKTGCPIYATRYTVFKRQAPLFQAQIPEPNTLHEASTGEKTDEIQGKILEVNENGYAGRIRHFCAQWSLLTSDSTILNWVKGYSIPFNKRPSQPHTLATKTINRNERKTYSICIHHLTSIGAVRKCKPCKDQFLSTYFLVPKPGGGFRFVLNLKKLNTFISISHFKMENFKAVKDMIFKDSYMCSIDLKDAYFSISVNRKHRKYLRFIFDNCLYEFTCLPFGLCTAPFVFTKLCKPILQHLRSKGIMLVMYLDDSIIISNSKEICSKNANVVISTFQDLGFVINYKKSMLHPNQSCKFLGFVFNSNKFIIQLPEDKVITAKQKFLNFLHCNFCKIRDLAKLLGVNLSRLFVWLVIF